MTARLVLEKEREDSSTGTVKPLLVDNGITYQGLSVGTWHIGDDGRIRILLFEDVDAIVHEKATIKAIRAELRAAEKDSKGEEIFPTITYDPVTKRFKEVW